MKRIIPDVVGFPNGCETVRFTACFVSMLMKAEGMGEADAQLFCAGRQGPCVLCGKCAGAPLERLHHQLYCLYTAVTGYGFLQIDLTDDAQMADGWELASQKQLRAFDDYVGFAMDYAGYDFEEVNAPESRAEIFAKIVASIDRGIPALLQLTHRCQWVLVTGYDDAGALYGLDGSSGYWGPSPALPDRYEDGHFVLTDWYAKLAHAFILGPKRAPGVTLDDALARGARILAWSRERGGFANTLAFLQDDAAVQNLDDAALTDLCMRLREWIGQPIDMRATLGWATNPMRLGQPPSRRTRALDAVHQLCWTTHDVLWIAWHLVGMYLPGEAEAWAQGLRDPAKRRALADCVDIVCRHDEGILEQLRALWG